MIQKLKLAAGAGLAALVLAACGNMADPIDPFPLEDKIPATASTSGTDPVVTGVSVAAGESVLFEVTIPPQVLNDMDFVWFEASTAAGVNEMTLYDSIVGTPRAALVSNSAGWFDTPTGHDGEAPPQLDVSDLTPADIDLNTACAGPCIGYAVSNNIGTTRYLRVSADADTSFDLYVYGGTLDSDIGLTRQSAQLISPEDDATVSGIIWSGMEQWYHVPEAVDSVTLAQFFAPGFNDGDMAFKANVYLQGDLVQTEAVLDATNATHNFDEATEGIFIKVYSYNESRAAKAGNARYSINAESFPVIPIGN